MTTVDYPERLRGHARAIYGDGVPEAVGAWLSWVGYDVARQCCCDIELILGCKSSAVDGVLEDRVGQTDLHDLDEDAMCHARMLKDAAAMRKRKES